MPATCKPLKLPQSRLELRHSRPDDIKVVMALGDSITAGFLARPGDAPHFRSGSGQRAQLPMTNVPTFEEWRGLAYPIGGDSGAVTLPNILAHWSPELTGMSVGHHPFQAFFAEDYGWRDTDDGLNGAVTGSHSESLVAQVAGE